MSRRNMVLLVLVAAMLVVIAAGYSLHENTPLHSEPDGPIGGDPISGSR